MTDPNLAFTILMLAAGYLLTVYLLLGLINAPSHPVALRKQRGHGGGHQSWGSARLAERFKHVADHRLHPTGAEDDGNA